MEDPFFQPSFPLCYALAYVQTFMIAKDWQDTREGMTN